MPLRSIGRIVHKSDALISKGSHPALVAAKFVIPLSLKAVNEVVVPTMLVKGPIIESTHVKPIPKFLYALQQKPTPL